MTEKNGLGRKLWKHRRLLPGLVVGRIVSPFYALANRLGASDIYVKIFRRTLARSFTRMFYLLRKNTFDQTYFMGKHVLKFPTDLWSYQEVIWDKRPDVIIETGVFLGGSTLFYSKLQAMMGNGRVIAMDITLDNMDPDLKDAANVTVLEGSSSDPDMVAQVKALISPNETVMVILDSDHAEEHVLAEMQLFSELVTADQYMIVEDGLIDRVYPLFNRGGPSRAIKRFMKQNQDFKVDHYRTRFLLTQNPGGYLLKTADISAAQSTEADNYRPLRLWLPFTQSPDDMRWLKLMGQNKRDEPE